MTCGANAVTASNAPSEACERLGGVPRIILEAHTSSGRFAYPATHKSRGLAHPVAAKR